MSFPLYFLVVSLFAYLASAIPHWDGFTNVDQIQMGGNYGFSGANPLEVIPSVSTHWGINKMFLSPKHPGQPENLTVAWPSRIKPSPGFYINHGQLYQFVNDSTIYPVNLVNTTGQAGADHPLQLVLGTRREGFNQGFWRWHGSMLYYDYGQWGNQGIYYRCRKDETDAYGIYTHISPQSTPQGCESVTIHTFTRDYQGRRHSQMKG